MIRIECTSEFTLWFRMLGHRAQAEIAHAIDREVGEAGERVGGTRSLYRLRAAGWRVLYTRNEAGMKLIAIEREDRRDAEPDD